MGRDAAATIEPVHPAAAPTAVYRVARRPSATFLVLERVAGARPEPGCYGGEIQIGAGRAPCGITVLDGGQGSEAWCSKRGPLPQVTVGEEATVRFALPGATSRR